MESEPGKEHIEMNEIGKLENLGMYCLTKVNMLCGNMSSRQSLTDKFQGRITTQGDPCSHYRERVCSVS